MDVFAVLGVPPEIQAYALAKYSRSDQKLAESVQELSTQRAEQFLATFYFQYGHGSIADLAHVTLGLEHISILAEFVTTDEPVWDGQSRSSRYQNFRRNGWYVPPLPDDLRARYDAAVERLLGAYEHLAAGLFDVLQAVTPRPDSMKPGAYKRALQARAFDVARATLPLAMHTSLGQIVSARVLEGQISRLAAHPLPEMQAIAADLRAACRAPARNFLDGKLAAAATQAGLSAGQLEMLRAALAGDGILDAPAAPTLVKYSDANPYPAAALERARAILAPHLADLADEPDRVTGAALAPPETDPLADLAATLAYLVDARGRSLAQLRPVTAALPTSEMAALLQATLADRGPHDDWLRLHRLGYAFTFDLCLDFGALRDLHRHRRCVHLVPDLKLDLGYEAPAEVFAAGLGAAGAQLAQERGLLARYDDALAGALAAAQAFPAREFAPYLLPLGARQRALFKMDLAEAAYIIELRTQAGGHFAYRRLAYEVYTQLVARHPALAPVIRAVPFQAPDAATLLAR